MRNLQLDIYDASESLVAVFSNELADACKILSARRRELAAERGGIDDTFTFSVPTAHPDVVHVLEDGFVGFFDLDSKYQLYRVLKTTRVEGEHPSITAECEHTYYELLDDQITDIRPTNTTAALAVEQALTGTRWELGTADNLGTNAVRLYYCSVLAGLTEIAAQWGGELRFRLDVVGGVIAHRYVDILARRGNDTGKQFEIGRDLVGVTQTIDKSALATALIGRGKGEEIPTDDPNDQAYGRRIDFADVVWSAAAGDPADKPAGQEWVGDEAAKALYGSAAGTRNRMRTVQFDDIEDPEALLQATWDELQARKAPLVNYGMSVVQLEGLSGYEHEAVRLGDTVGVVSTSFVGQARVIDIDRNLLDLTDANVQLGNYIPSIADKTRALQKQQQVMRDRIGAWDRAGKAILPNENTSNLSYMIDLLKTQLISTVSGVSTDVNGNMLIENPEKTKALLLGAGIFAIANGKSGGEYNWRTFGTGDGFVADLITTGTLLADLVKAGMLASADGSTWVNMETGTLSLGGGKITWDGTTLSIDAEAVKLAVGQIDATNEIKNGAFRFGATGWTLVGAYIDTGYGLNDLDSVRINGEIGTTKYAKQIVTYQTGVWEKRILSCYWVRDTYQVGTTNPVMGLYAEVLDTNGVMHYLAAWVPNEGTDWWWPRASIVIDPAEWNAGISEIYVYGYVRDISCTMTFDNFMLQAGDVLTAWSPNPNELKGAQYVFDNEAFKVIDANGTTIIDGSGVNASAVKIGGINNADGVLSVKNSSGQETARIDNTGIHSYNDQGESLNIESIQIKGLLNGKLAVIYGNLGLAYYDYWNAGENMTFYQGSVATANEHGQLIQLGASADWLNIGSATNGTAIQIRKAVTATDDLLNFWTTANFHGQALKNVGGGVAIDKYLGNTTHPDTLHATGHYGIYGRTELPGAGTGDLVVDAYSYDWVKQFWYPVDGTNTKGYRREFYYGTTWTSWIAN